jgi:hypothetical protein
VQHGKTRARWPHCYHLTWLGCLTEWLRHDSCITWVGEKFFTWQWRGWTIISATYPWLCACLATTLMPLLHLQVFSKAHLWSQFSYSSTLPTLSWLATPNTSRP